MKFGIEGDDYGLTLSCFTQNLVIASRRHASVADMFCHNADTSQMRDCRPGQVLIEKQLHAV